MTKQIVFVTAFILVTVGISQAAVEPPVTEGLLIGLDGSDVTVNSGNVESWNDQAALGGTQTFSQANGSRRPSLIANHVMPGGTTHNILDFNGTTEYLGLGADSNMETNTITVFAVVHADNMNDSNSGYYISTADSANDRRWTMGERGSPNKNWISLATSDSGSAKICDVTGANQEEWYITSMTWDGATTSNLNAQTVSENSYLLADTATDATSAVYTHVRTRIGADTFEPSRYEFDGQIAEILVYNRVLSAQEKSDVEQYLKYKYFRTATVVPPISDGLLIGLDGTDLMAVGDNIKFLNDQIEAGGASDFYQGTTAYRPTLITNSIMPSGHSHNIFDFNGTNQSFYLSATSCLSTNTFTSFLVVRANAMEDSATSYILSSADSTVRWATGERSTNNRWFILTRKSSGAAEIPDLTGIIQDQWHIVSMSWDGAGGDLHVRSLSQAGDQVTASKTGVFFTSAEHVRTRLGCNSDSVRNYFFNGQVAEVLIYGKALPLSDIESVRRVSDEKVLT